MTRFRFTYGESMVCRLIFAEDYCCCRNITYLWVAPRYSRNIIYQSGPYAIWPFSKYCSITKSKSAMHCGWNSLRLSRRNLRLNDEYLPKCTFSMFSKQNLIDANHKWYPCEMLESVGTGQSTQNRSKTKRNKQTNKSNHMDIGYKFTFYYFCLLMFWPKYFAFNIESLSGGQKCSWTKHLELGWNTKILLSQLCMLFFCIW